MLNIRNLTGALAIPLFLAFGIAAHADEWNKQTKITVNVPIAVPGTVLPAGTYIFKLVDSPSNRNIVQIMNPRQNHVFATVIAINNYRLVPTGHTVLTFYEVPAGEPAPVRAWFYPGDEYGQEFVYTRQEMAQLASMRTVEQAPPALAPAPPPPAVAEVAPPPAPAPEQPPEVAQNEPPAPPAPEAPAPAPAPAMPQTASEFPLLALAGLSLISVSAGIGVFARRMS